MKTYRKIIIAVSCVAVASGGIFGGYKINESRKKNKSVVDVVPVSYMSDGYWGDDLQLEGVVSSGDVQKIMQNESMLVEKILVNVGDTVTKGTPIVKYDVTLLELDVKQKENSLAVIKDNIAQTNKEIRRLQGIKSSEDIPPMPKPTEPPAQPPTEPPQVQTVSVVDDIQKAVSGKGTAESPYVFSCSEDAVVSAGVLNLIAENGVFAEFKVYSNGTLIYMWSVDGAKLAPGIAEDWSIGAGVVTDGMGNVSVDFSNGTYGSFFSFSSQNAPTEESYPEDDYYYSQDDYEQSFIKPGSDDYMYSRKEIAKMISEKQDELKKLEIDRKSADIAYRQALTKKEDGQALSLIDGVVTAVNDGSDPENTDPALVVIQGSQGVSIQAYIGELNLDKVSVGSYVTVNSYMTGSSVMAEITDIDMTPVKDYYNWNDNPNSSTYTFTASVTDETEGFNIGDWVGVSIMDSGEVSDSFYIPIHYTREEDGKYYVMRKGKNGRLEKKYISTGKVIYGSNIEIKGGLSKEDKICFPYGKKVREGVKTRETDSVQW